MARYLGPREKIERRLGAKLGLKGERSNSPKSATVKRMYPPGVHGKRFARKASEFGQQLKAKQKVRNMYRMLERQFKNWVKAAMESKEETGESIVRRLEHRLDNVVYRSGFAQSRDQARQVVNHGHIFVNGHRVSIPSFEIRKGDVIKVREGSLKTKYFSALVPQWIKKHESPQWLKVDHEQFTATVQGVPSFAESGIDAGDLQSLIEFYSR
ncbi:MAG: 30S ribosomal protein S4 [Patescibacteria group bacterium]